MPQRVPQRCLSTASQSLCVSGARVGGCGLNRGNFLERIRFRLPSRCACVGGLYVVNRAHNVHSRDLRFTFCILEDDKDLT